AVFKSLVWTGRPDQDFVMGEIELQWRAPSIKDFALVVDIASPDRQDQDFLFGLSQQSLGYGDIVSRRIGSNKFFVLLYAEDEVITVSIELSNLVVCPLECPSFGRPQDTSYAHNHQRNRNESFHMHHVLSVFSRSETDVAGGVPLLERTINCAGSRFPSGRW